MFTERFLRDNRGTRLDWDERNAIEAAVSEIRDIPPRSTIVHAGQPLQHSTLLMDGIMSRYIDDKHGVRQLAAVHFPGDFVDLHAFPLKGTSKNRASLMA